MAKRGNGFSQEVSRANPESSGRRNADIELSETREKFDLGFSVTADSVEAVKKKGGRVIGPELVTSKTRYQATGVLFEGRRPMPRGSFRVFWFQKRVNRDRGSR